MSESKFKTKTAKRIREMLPGCLVLLNDSSTQQGIPDMLVLHEDRWGMLEFKKSANASRQPNQEYFVEKANEMSFGAFICPENEEDVLDALRETLESRRSARVSKP